MTVALYATIWLSLVCLMVGELGRRRNRKPLLPCRLARNCSAAGVALALVHTLFALGGIYDWNHAQAVALTAKRTAAVYGAGWSGSLYLNYVFLGWWAADTLWWWRSPVAFLRRSGVLEWAWRLMTLMMVINGAVIFASTRGRIAGVPVVAGLLLIWGSDVSARAFSKRV